MNGNALNLNQQTDGPTATSVKKRESLQNGTQGEIQGTAEEAGDSDAGSSSLDDLDLHGKGRDISEGRMRAEAKSMRKVIVPRHNLYDKRF